MILRGKGDDMFNFFQIESNAKIDAIITYMLDTLKLALAATMSIALNGCSDKICEMDERNGPQIIDAAINELISRPGMRAYFSQYGVSDARSFINHFGETCCSASIMDTKKYDTIFFYKLYYEVIIEYDSKTDIILFDSCKNVI